jgi:hypothetical protein
VQNVGFSATEIQEYYQSIGEGEYCQHSPSAPPTLQGTLATIRSHISNAVFEAQERQSIVERYFSTAFQKEIEIPSGDLSDETLRLASNILEKSIRSALRPGLTSSSLQPSPDLCGEWVRAEWSGVLLFIAQNKNELVELSAARHVRSGCLGLLLVISVTASAAIVFQLSAG